MAPRSSIRPGLLFIALAAATAWLCAVLPVFAQEAYYWTYSRHLDLSYFDHPPMVAWLIWVGTHLFGDGSFGVRFGTWLCGLAASWLGVVILRDFGVDRRGQNAWLLIAVASPIVVMTHFLANPDAPLVAAWTTTIWAVWRARAGRLRWWLLAGIAGGFASLSKYSAAFLGFGGATLLLLDPTLRRQLRRPGPWLAVVVAAAMFGLVIWWNLQHDLESFRFQTTERLDKSQLGLHWFAQFVGSQLGVLHPVLAVAMVAGLGFLLRRVRSDARALHLLAFGAPLLGYLLIQSLWIQVKINWTAPAYVALLLGVALWWSELPAAGRRSLRLARSSLLLVPFALPLAPAVRLLPAGRGSSWTGWDEIAEHAERWEERFDHQDGVEGNMFFFAADYRDAAQLGRNLHLLWHRDGHHCCDTWDAGEPILAQNVLGLRALQFDHWAPPCKRIGQDAIFVLPRPVGREEVVKRAADRFAAVELVERVNVKRLGIDLVEAEIYVCRDYQGPGQR